MTQAKIFVSQDPMGAAYDLPAGPSELMIIADKEANPVFIAADLLSQAEHGVDSQVIFVTNDDALIIEVQAELKKQSFGMPRENIIKASLENGRCILVDSLEDAVSLSNQYAPEHLILQVEQPREWVSKILSAGSVFLGRWSPESAGDYASGTNHVLPTYGYASSYSGLSVDDFMTKISIQELSKSGLGSIREAIEQLADIEGLYAHKRAVSIRFEVGGES